MCKDFLVALSLANLLYIKVWNDTLYNYTYWLSSGAMSLVALVSNVLLLTLLIWCAVRFVRDFSSLARKAGFNTALAGWFLPYCRIIGNALTACSSPFRRDRHSQMTLTETMLDQTQEVLPAILPNRLINKNDRFLRIHEKQTHLLVYLSV